MNLRFPASLALAMVLAIPVANAAPLPAPKSVTVSFGDLDLTRPAGVATLRQRLAAAAYVVCTDDISTSLAEQIQRQKCRSVAMRRAMQQINPPVLMAAR